MVNALNNDFGTHVLPCHRIYLLLIFTLEWLSYVRTVRVACRTIPLTVFVLHRTVERLEKKNLNF